jgi:hypothetical protein
MASPNAADVRIGRFFYRLALGEHANIYGLPPLRRTWRSLFTESLVVPGAPNIQKLRPEDLRWLLTSFSGGEGQKVFRQGEPGSEARYFASVGVDFSVAGEIRLQRAVVPRGTGAAVTTVEASTFTNYSGASDLSGTDRKLESTEGIEHTLVPAAGLYQVDFYAYMDAPTLYEGSALTATGNAKHEVSGTNRKILWNGNTGSVRNDYAAKDPNEVEVSFTVKGLLPAAPPQITIVTVLLRIRRNTDDVIVAEKEIVMNSAGGDDFDAFKTHKLIFKPKAGKQYRYSVRLDFASVSDAGVEVDKIEEEPGPTVIQRVHCKVRNNTTATDLADQFVDIHSIETAGTKVATITFSANGADTYSFRFEAGTGIFRKIVADKVEHQLVAMNSPYNLDLGQGGRIWLVDQSVAAAPKAFYWDADLLKWTSAAQFGAANGKCVAMDASDSYEYALLDDKLVYRIDTGAAVQYTQAIVPTAVGVAVAANRLYILGEDVTNGTRLYEAALDDTAGLPLVVTQRDNPNLKGMVPDTTIVRRMAAMANGVVYFCNHSLRCVIYTWDAGSLTGSKFQVLPEGFQGRAIAHSMGITFVAGHFPAVDESGITRRRPALFQIDHLSTSSGTPTEVPIKLWRDVDPSSTVQDIQIYGSDLYILVQVDTDPKTIRLWRVSLRAPGGAFVEHEVTTDSSQQSGSARAFALNYLTRALAWSVGSPYVSGPDYITSGDAYLESSIFEFGLTEEKVVLRFDVDGEIPAGTSVEIHYRADQGDWTAAGTLTAPGPIPVSGADGSLLTTNLQLRAYLRSADVTKTPAIRLVGTQALLIRYGKTWDLLLDCSNESANYHVDGHQVGGDLLAKNLFDLAAIGQLVEFQDFYSSDDLTLAETYVVSVESPDQIFQRRGESLLRVRLTERS